MVFKRLSEFSGGQLLTIRATKAHLERNGSCLVVELSGNPEVMTTSKERREHFQTADSTWFEKQLERWKHGKSNIVEIATEEHPLEVLTGDICFILEIEGISYILSFYRDILPEGWLIPGGCPENLEGILKPRETAIREACEEVLIADKEGRIYWLRSPETSTLKFTAENILNWGLKSTVVVDLFAEELPIKKGEVQNLIIRTANGEFRTIDVAIGIDSKTASVSITLYWRIKIPVGLSSLQIFDGEKLPNGSLLNRPVRLTTLDGKLATIFSRGQNILSAGWITKRTKELTKLGRLI